MSKTDMSKTGSHRDDDTHKTDSTEETSGGPVQTLTVEDEAESTDVSRDVEESGQDEKPAKSTSEDAQADAEPGRLLEGFRGLQRRLRTIRWPKSRPADDTSDSDSSVKLVKDEAVEDETGAPGASTDVDDPDDDDQPKTARRRISWSQMIALGVLPGLALLLALTAGYLKWQDASAREAPTARAASIQAATESTVALLSYRPDTVQKDLEAAQGRLTGSFLDSYTKFVHEVVIPGSQQKQISAVATVPAAASTSATDDHAVVLLFVNTTIVVGNDPPTNRSSTVRVTLDKVDGRWLISQFEPV
jgi:Mce-associated membrane protein